MTVAFLWVFNVKQIEHVIRSSSLPQSIFNSEISLLSSGTFGTKYGWQTQHLQLCTDMIYFLMNRKDCLFRYDTLRTNNIKNYVSNFHKIHCQNYKIW
jgi:hypothetical protein